MNLQTTYAPLELKAVPGGAEGEFEGHGAVFSNVDSHGDVIVPGAFQASLAQHKARGSMPGLFIEHSAFKGGDSLPAGVWLELKEDVKGLYGRGKISALDTEFGRRVRGLVQDGALRGLSIAFAVPPNGAVYGKAAGEPKRTLKAIDLHAVDLVSAPSNPHARVAEVKTFANRADVEDLLIENGVARGAARKMSGPAWAALSGESAPYPDPAAAELLRVLDRSSLDLANLKGLFL